MCCFIEQTNIIKRIIVINNEMINTYTNACYMSMCNQLIYANEGTTWVGNLQDVIYHELILWFMKFKRNFMLNTLVMIIFYYELWVHFQMGEN